MLYTQSSTGPADLGSGALLELALMPSLLASDSCSRQHIAKTALQLRGSRLDGEGLDSTQSLTLMGTWYNRYMTATAGLQ